MDIVIVDDHAALREEMVMLMEQHEDWRVIGQASGGQDAIRLADEQRPDLIVMDVVMPGMNGIEATRAILESHPGMCVLGLSNHVGRDLVQAMLDAGAMGYVRKDRAYEELIPAILAVTAGQRYIGEGVNT